MFNAGASWYGFTNGTGPTNTSDILTYMTMYATSGVAGLPTVVSSTIPQSGPSQYLFDEIIISTGTVPENAWYTLLIPQDSIGSSTNRLTKILQDTSTAYGNELTTSSTYYNLGLVNFSGSGFANTNYRLYTTFNSQNLRLNNTSSPLYFKGGTVS